MNYHPLLRRIENDGGEVSLVTFPRLCDPDHRGLYDTSFAVRSSYPIDRSGALIGGTLDQIAGDIGSPDILMLGTCNLGPERVIGGMTGAGIVIGLQHGFYQDWEDYEHNPALPTIGIFGSGFAARVAKPRVVLGLPKLDLVPRLERNPDGDILYAGQYSNHHEQLRTCLADLQRSSGKRVVVRPHPEGREHLDMLRPDFEFLDPEQPLADAMGRAALLLTTGSTVVLEAMVADVPVVVLPDCHGLLYEPAGIVAREIGAAAVTDVWNAAPGREFSTRQFLRDYSGSDANDRTDRAYAALLDLVHARQA
ncbi:hypothetical protein [Sphingomonas profundi]|uniref:hypothetical protein n=1 Tax=Alterirhizorhabdus profundi TaxID=2681549 RepID=UPI0012E86F93|nr:hypothetical protein [Sphingomonas profundi]